MKASDVHTGDNNREHSEPSPKETVLPGLVVRGRERFCVALLFSLLWVTSCTLLIHDVGCDSDSKRQGSKTS